MRQAVMTAPGTIEFREAPVPSPGPGQVLLRIVRIGICGSDVHVYHGLHPYTSYPVVQGHEFCAVVEAVGPGVTELQPGSENVSQNHEAGFLRAENDGIGKGLGIGSKVTAMPQIVCGKCLSCRRGDYHICDALKVQGFQAPGCAQDLFVTEAGKIVSLPGDFSFEQGALVEPVAVAVHAVSRAGAIAGKNVVVLGAGPIGNLVAQVARAAGAKVLITDLSDYRLDVAAQCGIEHVSNTRRESLAEASQRAFGDEGFSTAWECAGNEAAVDAAVQNIGKGGTIVAVGVFAQKPRVDLGLVQDRELTVIGTLMYQRHDYDQAVGAIVGGAIATYPLDTKHFPFEQYLDAYHFIEKQADRSMKVFIDL